MSEQYRKLVEFLRAHWKLAVAVAVGVVALLAGLREALSSGLGF